MKMNSDSATKKKNKMKEVTIKMREDRVRRLLKKRGCVLTKKRAWTHPEAYQGEYMINNQSNFIQAGGTGNGFDMSLDEVEKWAKE